MQAIIVFLSILSFSVFSLEFEFRQVYHDWSDSNNKLMQWCYITIDGVELRTGFTGDSDAHMMVSSRKLGTKFDEDTITEFRRIAVALHGNGLAMPARDSWNRLRVYTTYYSRRNPSDKFDLLQLRTRDMGTSMSLRDKAAKSLIKMMDALCPNKKI